MIGFNSPYFTGKETAYIKDAVNRAHISGNGYYTNKCHQFFQKKYGFQKCLLTTSCSDALEMAAILIDLQPENEVIVPSYTFVSSANAFIMNGAKIVFADSREDHPGINEDGIEELITNKTKAIVIVHYAGFACDMEKIMSIADKYNLFVIEDAAHAVDSFYDKKPLGAWGHLATFSFHETKNIMCGEGGMLVINDAQFLKRSEIIWEKGTNRAAFFRGEIDKYGWVDIGSSFLPSEIVAAFLYAQLEKIDEIQAKRIELWNFYFESLKPIAERGLLRIPAVPSYSTINGHLFYLVTNSGHQRDELIGHLKKKGIQAVFHYMSLHRSKFYTEKHDGRELPNSDRYSDCLLRLPLYYDLEQSDQETIIDEIKAYFNN